MFDRTRFKCERAKLFNSFLEDRHFSEEFEPLSAIFSVSKSYSFYIPICSDSRVYKGDIYMIKDI